MELPGAVYLYTLATLAMTFAGFCAIVIGLRCVKPPANAYRASTLF